MTPKQVDYHMRHALAEAVQILFPVGVDPESHVKRHIWRTRKDLGEVSGRVVAWTGWSVNLGKLNKGYRTLYIDYVPNLLDYSDRLKLFGAVFAERIANMASFVAMFVTSFPKGTRDTITESGLLVREIGPKLHATEIIDADVFLTQPSLLWAAYLARLANFQRHILSGRLYSIDESSEADASEAASCLDDLAWEDEHNLLDL